jgi:hypothetical protein
VWPAPQRRDAGARVENYDVILIPKCDSVADDGKFCGDGGKSGDRNGRPRSVSVAANFELIGARFALSKPFPITAVVAPKGCGRRWRNAETASADARFSFVSRSGGLYRNLNLPRSRCRRMNRSPRCSSCCGQWSRSDMGGNPWRDHPGDVNAPACRKVNDIQRRADPAGAAPGSFRRNAMNFRKTGAASVASRSVGYAAQR